MSAVGTELGTRRGDTVKRAFAECLLIVKTCMQAKPTAKLSSASPTLCLVLCRLLRRIFLISSSRLFEMLGIARRLAGPLGSTFLWTHDNSYFWKVCPNNKKKMGTFPVLPVTSQELCSRDVFDWHLPHGHGRHDRGQLGGAPALHQHHGLFHLQLVVEGDELRLCGALACDQPPLNVGLIEAVQPTAETSINLPFGPGAKQYIK